MSFYIVRPSDLSKKARAPDKSSGKRRQGIRIAYDLIGFIPLSELEKEETA